MSCVVLVGLFAVRAAYGVQVPAGPPYCAARMVCPEGGPFAFSHGSTVVELPNGDLFCAWYAGSREKGDDVAIVAAELPSGADAWSAHRVLVDTPGKSEGNPVLFLDASGTLWLFYQTMYGSGEGPTQQGTGWTTCKVKTITSRDGGKTWSEERILIDELGYLTRNKVTVLKDGTVLLPIHDERNWSSRVLISQDKGITWELSGPIDCGLGFHNGNIEPGLLERNDGGVLCYMRTGSKRYRTWKSVSTDQGRTWTKPVEIDVPNPNAALDLLRLKNGHVLLALNPVPEGGRRQLSVWLSTDDAETWAMFRDVENGEGHASYPTMIESSDGLVHMTYSRPNGGIKHVTFNEAWVWEHSLLKGEVKTANVVPPLDDPDDRRPGRQRKASELPIAVPPFGEHRKTLLAGPERETIIGLALDAVGSLRVITEDGDEFVQDASGNWAKSANPRLDAIEGTRLSRAASFEIESIRGKWRVLSVPAGEQAAASDCVVQDGALWVGTDKGLFSDGVRHEAYGVDGPLSTRITALALDSKGTLWIGTPLGLSVRTRDGAWQHIRGKDGLPYEDVTAIAVDGGDRLWIGTTRGAIHYRPYESGRQWFYRAGKRYLPDDYVLDVAVTSDGKTAYFATKAGLSRIDDVTTTLLEKAQIIEKRLNERHRRLGLVAECTLDNAENPTSHVISDNDNDGLWTAYHVAAMSLCYAATADEAALQSAKESMHALYMLQNASGTPGLVARSVVPAEIGKTKSAQWRPTPDGSMYWKSDTSSDEIDGHYLAFYTYWEHIARFIPGERELCIKQVRALTDYLVDNGYQLIDWHGRRTRWGFWAPKSLNEDPNDYLENGLNSLQMLSFLKVAHHITGDVKYKEHYDRLIVEHGYLSNVLLEKKVFPDENNHSDDQLGYVAWYPILQLEWDPKVRRLLQSAVRRHYKIVAPEKPSFYAFVTATIDPGYVDLDAAVENLREIPTDRRGWRMENSHRADVVVDPMIDRFGRKQLQHVLPADERDFAKWNQNPYIPDAGGDGCHEDDGAAYLLPYWMGRYHGFIAEVE